MIEGLKDKIVIVTGGGNGIGKVYCFDFASRSRVIVADIDRPAAEQVAGQIAKEKTPERQVKNSFFSWRPLRLCARYSDFWLRRSRVRFFVVKFIIES